MTFFAKPPFSLKKQRQQRATFLKTAVSKGYQNLNLYRQINILMENVGISNIIASLRKKTVLVGFGAVGAGNQPE